MLVLITNKVSAIVSRRFPLNCLEGSALEHIRSSGICIGARDGVTRIDHAPNEQIKSNSLRIVLSCKWLEAPKKHLCPQKVNNPGNKCDVFLLSDLLQGALEGGLAGFSWHREESNNWILAEEVM